MDNRNRGGKASRTEEGEEGRGPAGHIHCERSDSPSPLVSAFRRRLAHLSTARAGVHSFTLSTSYRECTPPSTLPPSPSLVLVDYQLRDAPRTLASLSFPPRPTRLQPCPSSSTLSLQQRVHLQRSLPHRCTLSLPTTRFPCRPTSVAPRFEQRQRQRNSKRRRPPLATLDTVWLHYQVAA